ncbi:hypothetical protein HRG_013440 [Hirsutella rhossiliensis]
MRKISRLSRSLLETSERVKRSSGAVVSGVHDVANPENMTLCEVSWRPRKAVGEIPASLEGGFDDLKKAPTDIAAAFQKLPGQLAKAAADFMTEYNKFLPVSSHHY